MAENQTKTLTDLIALLAPLEEEDRQKILHAALVFLGSTPVATSKQEKNLPGDEKAGEDEPQTDLSRKRRASQWLKQNDFTLESLEDVFHFSDDEVEVIASDLPGSGAKQKTEQCYLLFGIKSLLQEGEPKIDDKQARSLCRELGCFDSPNHSKSVEAMGNQISGNKANGFVLTAPGLRAAAELVKQLTTPKQ